MYNQIAPPRVLIKCRLLVNITRRTAVCDASYQLTFGTQSCLCPPPRSSPSLSSCRYTDIPSKSKWADQAAQTAVAMRPWPCVVLWQVNDTRRLRFKLRIIFCEGLEKVIKEKTLHARVAARSHGLYQYALLAYTPVQIPCLLKSACFGSNIPPTEMEVHWHEQVFSSLQVGSFFGIMQLQLDTCLKSCVCTLQQLQSIFGPVEHHEITHIVKFICLSFKSTCRWTRFTFCTYGTMTAIAEIKISIKVSRIISLYSSLPPSVSSIWPKRKGPLRRGAFMLILLSSNFNIKPMRLEGGIGWICLVHHTISWPWRWEWASNSTPAPTWTSLLRCPRIHSLLLLSMGSRHIKSHFPDGRNILAKHPQHRHLISRLIRRVAENEGSRW